MATFDSIQTRKAELIRKALGGSVFIAPMETTLPVSLTSTADSTLTALPEGWEDLGYLSKDDGASWTRETELSEVTSWGSLEATRSDINSDVTSLSVTAQETKALTLSLYENIDLTDVKGDAVTSEVTFARPTRPSTRYNRLLAICVDGEGDDAIYIGKLCPRAQVTEVGDQVWTDGDDPIAYPLTFQAKTDSTAGYALRYFFGGPGWASLLLEMGFTKAVAG